MNIPKPSKEDKDLFLSLSPKDPRVTTKLVFGNDAAFVNGNMFFGIYGKDVFLRLSPEDSKELLTKKGARPFEPMPGHAMSGYFVVPREWRTVRHLDDWIDRAMQWTNSLPKKRQKK